MIRQGLTRQQYRACYDRSAMAVALPRDRVRAPELVGEAGWLNTDRPLSLAALRGKIILLDFWTYCCINCMHVLPDLKRLEEKYPRELVVIGVHSAKFTNERETENIRQAILRYEIVHPVVNDRNFVNWRAYGVRAWPTLMVIDAEGCVVGTVSIGRASTILKGWPWSGTPSTSPTLKTI